VVATELLGGIDCLFRSAGDIACGDGNAELGEQFFGLILVKVHAAPWLR